MPSERVLRRCGVAWSLLLPTPRFRAGRLFAGAPEWAGGGTVAAASGLGGARRGAPRERAREADAGEAGEEKFMVTFPYPYMNGLLHLGHSYSLTKASGCVYRRGSGGGTGLGLRLHRGSGAGGQPGGRPGARSVGRAGRAH